jgi:hypothetical protein
MGPSCPGLDTAQVRKAEWKVKEAQNDAQGWGRDTHPSSPLEEGRGAPIDDKRQTEWSASDSKALISYPSHNHGWSSVEGGVKVAIEVCSDVVELGKEHSTCRSLMIIDCLSFLDLFSLLCHSAVGTSLGSCTSSGSS